MQIALAFFLILIPIIFNWTFASLSNQFDYSDILRQPTNLVLAKFRAGGSRLVMTWWLFALSAVGFGFLAVLLPIQFSFDPAMTALVATLGLLASLTQFLGLVRWPFVVPHLAREAENASKEKLDALDVVFQSLNRYLGVAVGEHLGYLFTGLWSFALGAGLLLQDQVSHSGWYVAFGISGLILGGLLVLCSLEFVGRNEQNGWKLASTITPFVYIAWSLWLVAMGISMMLGTIAG